jgi:hypothetical protein
MMTVQHRPHSVQAMKQTKWQLHGLQISDPHKSACQNQREEMLHHHLDHSKRMNTELDLQLLLQHLEQVANKD